MNQGTFIAVKPRRSPWARLWSRWFVRRWSHSEPAVPDGNCVISLVGTFDDEEALIRANRGFTSAAFGADEVLCLIGNECDFLRMLWARLARFLDKPFRRPFAGDQLVLLDVSEQFRGYLQSVLKSGGGIVLIRSAARFQQAAQLIYGAGGRVGFEPHQSCIDMCANKR